MKAETCLLSDLIPQRHGTYWFFGLLSVGGMAVLSYGYMKMPQLAEKCGLERLGPLDLETPGSLFSWWMAVLWLLAAVTAWFIFQHSRTPAFQEIVNTKNETVGGENSHPGGDAANRGGSRLADIWLWAGLGCLFLSIDETVRFRELLRELLLMHGGARFNDGGDFWWIGIYFLFFFGLIGTRLVVEMRRFFPAMNFFLAAMLFFVAASAVQLGALDENDRFSPEELLMLRCSAEMGAILLLLISFAVYARFLVLLDPEMTLRWLGERWNENKELKPSADDLKFIREANEFVLSFLREANVHGDIKEVMPDALAQIILYEKNSPIMQLVALSKDDSEEVRNRAKLSLERLGLSGIPANPETSPETEE